MSEVKNAKEVYEKEWKEVVENEDGTINRSALEQVLAEYSRLMDNVTEVYDELTSFSKPHTPASVIIGAINDKYILKETAFADLASELEDGKVNVNFDELADYFDIDEFDRKEVKENLGDRL